MANTYADRVKETTTTTGTGAYDLDGAVGGYQTFVAGVGDTSTVYYVVEDGTDWEVGTGTVTDAATDTLSRDTIHASSNAGSAVNWGAGSKNVSLTFPARSAVGNSQAILSHRVSNGTQVASTASSWQTYPLNTEESDTDGIVSLSSNQFTLGAGEYKIRGNACNFRADQLTLRLRNTTDGTTEFIGQPTRSQDTTHGLYNHIEGILTISASKTFELQYYCNASEADGLGPGFSGLSGAGVDNVFGQVFIEKRVARG